MSATSGPLAVMAAAAALILPLVVVELWDAPGGLLAVVVVLASLAASVGLGFQAIRSPVYSGRLIATLLVLLATYGAIFAQVPHVPASLGPVVSLGLVCLAVPMAVLGRVRPRTAGWLLVAGALVAPFDLLLFVVLHPKGDAGGLGLVGSPGALAAAMLLTGAWSLLLSWRVPEVRLEPTIDGLRQPTFPSPPAGGASGA